jgi:hypothetical protein
VRTSYWSSCCWRDPSFWYGLSCPGACIWGFLLVNLEGRVASFIMPANRNCGVVASGVEARKTSQRPSAAT